MNLSQIIEKIHNREYFSYVRLLHGLWERLYYISEPPRTLESVKESIRTSVRLPAPQTAYPPQDPEFWRAKNLRMLDDYLIEVLDMVGQPGHVIWGVGTSGFEDQSFGHEESKAIISLLPPDRILYDGYIWKRAFKDGSITQFFDAIRDKQVVVIGMHHLKDINDHLRFPKFEFYPVEMPLEPRREEMMTEWLEFHKKFDEDVVYLTQLAAVGTWIIGKIDDRLDRAFVFDMGRAIDFWAEDRPPQRWHEEVPEDIKNRLNRL